MNSNKIPAFFLSVQALAKAAPDSPVLVALSGGADSSALLCILSEMRKITPFPLFAAHVNHGIRTKEYNNEALRDRDFCIKLCEKHGVKLFIKDADLPKLAKESKESLETAARKLRYDFFAEIMNENNIKLLATAHNASDNIETMIFNIARGCSLSGLCGIPVTRPLDGVEGGLVIRPMLSATKEEILDYCKENSVEFVLDSTNLEENCTRNVIRHRIVPQLKQLFTTPERACTRLAQSALRDEEYLMGEARRYLDAWHGRLNVKELLSLHKAISSRMISESFADLNGTGLEFVHINSIFSLIESGEKGFISLPCNSRACFDGESLIFEQDTKVKTEKNEYSIALSLGLNKVCEDFLILVSEKQEEEKNTLALNCEKYEIYASVSFSADITRLSARSRQNGDVIFDNSMHKKVKKLLCDKKIPNTIRASLPMICEDGEIVYIPFVALCDKKRAQDENKIFITTYKKLRGKYAAGH